MSVKVMGLVWDYYPEGGGELLTALKVADHADHDGCNIWPSVSTLADQTRQSERTVQRHLQAMATRGWLLQVKAGGAGPGSTTRYRMPVERIPLGVEARVTKRHPAAKGDIGSKKGDTGDKKGDTAMSPEPSLKQPSSKATTPAGGAAPTPVAAGFKAYSDGIQAKYGSPYPPSRRANGMLAQVVAQVGGEFVVPVVQWYLAHQDPFYARPKHALGYLVRDCAKFLIELQAKASGGAPKAPTHARVALLAADGKVMRELDQQPAGDMEAIARKARKDYARLIATLEPRYVAVRQGTERRQFSVEELPA